MPAPLTIYKCFIRPHVDYDDIIYDQTYNLFFHLKIELMQYNAASAITVAIRGSSRNSCIKFRVFSTAAMLLL